MNTGKISNLFQKLPKIVKKRKLTRTPPLSLPKASSYSGRRTNRETEMLKLRLRNPEPLNRDDDLALSRRQGRDMATIRHWKSELRTFRALPTPKKIFISQSLV